MPNPDIASPTEIFVPQHLYPDGFVVEVSDNLEWEKDEFAEHKILVRVLVADNNVGFVKISPR